MNCLFAYLTFALTCLLLHISTSLRISALFPGQSSERDNQTWLLVFRSTLLDLFCVNWDVKAESIWCGHPIELYCGRNLHMWLYGCLWIFFSRHLLLIHLDGDRHRPAIILHWVTIIHIGHLLWWNGWLWFLALTVFAFFIALATLRDVASRRKCLTNWLRISISSTTCFGKFLLKFVIFMQASTNSGPLYLSIKPKSKTLV